MKNLIIKTWRAIIPIFVFSVMLSCNNSSDETDHIDPEEPQEARIVSIGFDGYTLTPDQEPRDRLSKSEVTHNYVTDGYTINITGGIAPEDAYHQNINITEGFTVEVTGDIVITVSHPRFYNNNVLQEAFYGIQNYPVPTGTSDNNIVDLELVQGFVMVTSDELAEPLITSIKILGQPAELDIVYYLDTPVVDVLVETDGYGTLRGEHNTELGEGVQYNVTISGEGIEFTFPEFGDPGDGIWNP